MSTSLYAMEDGDIDNQEVELESTPEEGEVAEVVIEVSVNVDEADEVAEAADDGMEASDKLEEIKDIVEGADAEGGLTPVAAEAIRVAIECVMENIGADPKNIYSLYAAENFDSAATRKANTAIAAENIGEFLADLWKRIKAAISKLWAKVKAFWDKHVSSLGQVKKALESMKKKVNASSGKITGNAVIEKAPSAMANAFASEDASDITQAVVAKYVKAHASKEGDTLVDNIGKSLEALSAKVKEAAPKIKDLTADQVEGIMKDIEGKGADSSYGSLGTKSEPLVGGVYYALKTEREEGNTSFSLERETIEAKSEGASLVVTTKENLVSLLSSVSALIDANIKRKAEVDKSNGIVTKTSNEINSSLNKVITEDSLPKEGSKLVRNLLKNYNRYAIVMAKAYNVKTALDIKLAKAVLGYSAICLKQYAAK